MMIQNVRRFFFLAMLLGCMACGGGRKSKAGDQVKELAQKIGRTTMIEDYPKVPNEELIQDLDAGTVYFQLQRRFDLGLMTLQAATNRDKVHLLVLVMTPEVGKYATQPNTYGIPYILQTCTNLKVDMENLTPAIAQWSARDDGENAPHYGNWSREGAAYVAAQLAPVIAAYGKYHSSTTYSADQRPATFGDATRENNGLDDFNDMPHGGDKTPYNLHINGQGLRMDKDLTFPKTRQRIVFMGDSRIFNPFLDDENTITNRLQAMFPDKEIVNAGNITCCMDDYVSLYEEKVRFAEPDVLIVCANGGDILDEYFTHRNRFSRNKVCYRPTEEERIFYEKTFKKK